MKRKSKIARAKRSAGLIAKPIGQGKAKKFAAVEGLSLNKKSVELMADSQKRGLKGDPLRSLIASNFVKKSG